MSRLNETPTARWEAGRRWVLHRALAAAQPGARFASPLRAVVSLRVQSSSNRTHKDVTGVNSAADWGCNSVAGHVLRMYQALGSILNMYQALGSINKQEE